MVTGSWCYLLFTDFFLGFRVNIRQMENRIFIKFFIFLIELTIFQNTGSRLNAKGNKTNDTSIIPYREHNVGGIPKSVQKLCFVCCCKDNSYFCENIHNEKRRMKESLECPHCSHEKKKLIHFNEKYMGQHTYNGMYGYTAVLFILYHSFTHKPLLKNVYFTHH